VTLAYGPNGSTPPAMTPSGQLVVDPVPVVVPERSYAIEAGLEFLFGGDWGQGSFTAFQDVSKAHEGYELAAEYSYRWVRGRFSLSPSVGLRYKSDKRNDYYWGVHADETSPVLLGYQAEAGVNYQAGLRASAYLTRHLRLALSANYERLDSSIADSPLVARPYVFGYFAGLAFQF
jgi:MipA family protein